MVHLSKGGIRLRGQRGLWEKKFALVMSLTMAEMDSTKVGRQRSGDYLALWLTNTVTANFRSGRCQDVYKTGPIGVFSTMGKGNLEQQSNYQKLSQCLRTIQCIWSFQIWTRVSQLTPSSVQVMVGITVHSILTVGMGMTDLSFKGNRWDHL